MIPALTTALMLLLSTDAAQPPEAARLPEGITVGEDQPPQTVRSRTEAGEFAEERLSYRLRYTRTNTLHAFRISVNNRHFVAEIPHAAFPDLRIDDMDLYPSGHVDPSLVITIPYGEPVECFSNVAPREALRLAFYEVPEVRKLSYEDCTAQDVIVRDPRVRIREIVRRRG